MSPIDVVLIILCGLGFYRGFKNGILIEITTLAALLLGFYGAQHLAAFTARFLNERLAWEPEQMYLISLIISFIMIVLVVYLLGKALTKMAAMILLGGVNKILGGFFGILKVLIILSVILAYGNEYYDLVTHLPQEFHENSRGLRSLETFGNFLIQKVFISENLNKIKSLF